MRRLVLLLPALFVAVARPAAPPPAPALQKWTAEDVVHTETAGDFRVSPDGRFAVWVKAAPDKDKNERVGQIHRVDLRTHREVQLTRAAEGCSSPRWSP